MHTDGETPKRGQLLMAIQERSAEPFAGGEVPSRNLADRIAETATVWPGGGSARARVDAIVFALETYFVHHPQPDAFYRPTNAKNIPYLTGYVAMTMADGGSLVLNLTSCQG